MIRALVIVAVAGLLMSVVFISGAVALGGPDALARSAFSWTWDRDWEDDRGVWRHGMGPAGQLNQREYPWSGQRLEVNAPAEIDYVQAAGPAKLVIRGPAETLERVQVDGGRITLSGRPRHWARLSISLTAPDVNRFELNGSDRLNIRSYKQDELTLIGNGRAEIRAQGEARTVRLDLSGHGEADLGALKTEGAAIDISGAGEAVVGPTEWARVQISGMGEVDLLTRPKRLETDIAGAGRVRQPDVGAASPPREDETDEAPARAT